MKNRKLRLLLVNDDGIRADGLKHLYESLKDKAEIFIAAPTSEKSGSGLAMTLTTPIKTERVSWDNNTPAWAVSGTPTDCVKLALNSLLPFHPDFIVSGINRGSNAGRSVLYSGTIGGVIEGMFSSEIRGIAFSAADYANPDYHHFGHYIYPLIRYSLQHSLPQGSFLNVNFPSVKEGGIKGVKMARQGKGFWTDNPDKRVDPEGVPYYWLGGKWKHFEEEADSDVALLQKGYITVAPIHVSELTDHLHLFNHKKGFDELFEKEFPNFL